MSPFCLYHSKTFPCPSPIPGILILTVEVRSNLKLQVKETAQNENTVGDPTSLLAFIPIA